MGQKILILGGKGDIGQAIAKNFCQESDNIARLIGREECDLADYDKITNYLTSLDMDYDVIIHCAAINIVGEHETCSQEFLERVMRVNTFSLLEFIKKMKPYWESVQRGKVIVINSLYGELARRGRLPYVTSKHALHGLMKTLAIELASIGVLVNAVSPGFVDTKLTRQNNSEEKIKAFEDSIPLHRLARPEEIAHVVSFLSSPLNTYITGENITIDGGYSIGGFQG